MITVVSASLFSATSVSGGGVLGGLSDVFVWLLVLALPVVAMAALHMYLSLRARGTEYAYLAGLGLFLLMQVLLVGEPQPLQTLLFILLLYPSAVKTFASSIKDAVRRGRRGDGSVESEPILTIVGDGCFSADSSHKSPAARSNGDGTDVDVLLIKRGVLVRGMSALRVSSMTSVAQPLACMTLLTALSRLNQQQRQKDGGRFVEWAFNIDVSESGGIDHRFIVLADGKLNGGKVEEREEGRIVELVRTSTLYLRSALRSAGLIEEEEVQFSPAIELVKEAAGGKNSYGDGGDEEGRSSSFKVVSLMGLPERIVSIEEGSSGQSRVVLVGSNQYLNHSVGAAADYSPRQALQHPVGRLIRQMVAENITASYIVHFRKAEPPEGVTIIDNGMIDAAAALSGVPRVDGRGRVIVGGGRASLSTLNMTMRSSVAGRMHAAEREDLASEVTGGIKRGYWNVQAYVAVNNREGKGEEDYHRTDCGGVDSASAVKVASALVSCFSGPSRTMDAKVIEQNHCGSPLSKLIYHYANRNSCPWGGFPPPATAEMSSDTLASLVTLSPPYPTPACEASSLADFEIPPNDKNSNGLIHLGKAYFRGTLVGELKISVEDLSMHIDVLGETGLGKSTFAVDLLRQLWDLDPTVNWVIIDLKGEYYHRLQQQIGEGIVVLQAGGCIDGVHRAADAGVGVPLHIDLLRDGRRNHSGKRDEGAEDDRIGRLFSALKESLAGLFKDNSELSPMMERILSESLRMVMTPANAGDPGAAIEGSGFFDALFDTVRRYVESHRRRDIVMSGEALKNRLERFRRGVVGEVLNSGNHQTGRGKDSIEYDFREMLRTRKMIIDLSGCVRRGCSKEDIRLLLNIITSVIFEEAFARGLVGAPVLRHLTVIEEANILVPDVLKRRTMGDLTATEDMILTARGFGEGLILVAQRPTISSFILANAGTKIVFRSPFDSRKIGEFMGLNESQAEVVKSLRKFEALVTTIRGGPYWVSTAKPQQPQALSSPEGETRLEKPRRVLVHSMSQATPPTRAAIVEIGELDESSTQDGVASVGVARNDVGRESISAVHEEGAKRLLRRKNSSGKFKLFKKIASSLQSGIAVPDVVRSVFRGEEWRYNDAFRSLTDAGVWGEPLIVLVGENRTLRLTEYGKEVWRAVLRGGEQEKEKTSGRR